MIPLSPSSQASYGPDGRIVIRSSAPAPEQQPAPLVQHEAMRPASVPPPVAPPVQPTTRPAPRGSWELRRLDADLLDLCETASVAHLTTTLPSAPPPPAPPPAPVVPQGPSALERLSERCVSVRRHVEQAVQAEMHTLRTQLYSLRSSVHTELQHVLDGVTQQTTAAIDEVRRSATHAAAEGAAQVGSTLRASGLVRHQLYDESRTLLGRVWTFLTQPVLVPRSRGEARVQRRGLLFLQDTLRFGGTFAGIFAALFLTLNAQSFWQIALANLDPLAGHDTGQEIAEHLIAQAQPNPLNEDQAIAVVPTVGPPEDRLVIPRLGLNVPIVTPRLDALLAQDWTILEQDIQTALEDGVVHYPGTAEPGQAGNFFVTGHSSYYAWAEGDYKSVFARLSELQPGDEYWVYYGGDEHRYRVVESLEVKPTEVHVLDQPTDQRQSTLMTCSPVGTTLRRRIVRALEVDVASGQLLAVGEHGTQPNLPKVQLNALPI